MKFKIDQFNYQSLPRLAEVLRQNKAEKIELKLTKQVEDLPFLPDIVPYLYQLMDYEPYFQVEIRDFPFCLITLESLDHIKSKQSGEKIEDCGKCRWNRICSGFPKGYLEKYNLQEIRPVPDLPLEVMIEVTPKCNFNCQFCFNYISFAQDGRNIKELSTVYFKKIIDNISQAGIKIVKFTGGEPILRINIFSLLKYAKEKDLEVRLNTNASLINQKTVKKLKGIVDNILIPIESYTDKKEEKITGYTHSLKKKIKAIELLKKQDIPVVRAGTVAIKENILNFDKIAKLINQLSLDEWELYRPIPLSKKDNLSSQLINILADKLIDLRKKTDRPVFIANALPFCSIKDLKKINSVSKGALYDDGHNRLVIDPRSFVKPHYFLDENLGQSTDILKAWQSDFSKKMRNLKFLPEQCQRCLFVFKCRGGSRQAAKMIYGDYQALDPLANPKNAL